MKRIVLMLVALGALAIPASASAEVSPSDFKNAAKYCKALRASQDVQTFRAAFGGKKNAYGKCVSRTAKARHLALRRAVAECKAELNTIPPATSSGSERALGRGPEGAKPNGERPNGENKARQLERQALRRCVHAKLKKVVEQKLDDLVAAVKACREERSKDVAAFRDHYGTNANDRNAFGKCVSQHVRADNEKPSA
jgi:hypothetical protein